MRKLKTVSIEKKILKLKEQNCALTIEKELYSKNKIVNIQNSNASSGCCINCNEKPCYQFKKEEINPEIISGLTYNNTLHVCPTDSIDISGTIPSINTDSCIGCGLCVKRCPIGGVYIDELTNTANINFEANELFDVIESSELPSIDNILVLVSQEIIKPTKINKEHALYFHQKLNHFLPKLSQLELLIIRNFCLEIGLGCKVGAKGNNDNRLDFIALKEEFYLPGEAELKGDDILGLPRRILEDIAILKSRFGVELNCQIPLLFVGSFPNKRSDFYEVLTDIKNVIGIEVRTISIHQLFLFVLSNIRLDINLIFKLHIDKAQPNLSAVFTENLPELETLDPFFGGTFYNPVK